MTKGSNISTKFHIEILVILKDAQQTHGLRHKDFQSYRQFISRKLHRIRKSLNFQQGKGNKVVPRKINRTMLNDQRYILLKLFEAERAWAAAMQLKSESNNDHRKVFHMKSRLRKAVTLSKELWELCKWGKCDEHGDVEECELCAQTDARSYVEAQAYYYNMQGVQCFEIAEWKKAKLFYEKALKEYSGLAKAVDNEKRGIYESKMEELSPLVRYCANNAGEMSIADDMTAIQAAGSDLDQFNDLLKQIYRNQVAVVTEVNWLGRNIPVKHETVKLAVLALKDANIELRKSDIENEAKIKIFDSLLKTFTDALMVIRDELKTTSSNTGVSNQTQIAFLPLDSLSRTQLLFAYLNYVKLAKTVERNLVIIETNQDSSGNRPQNMARLYDTVLQNLQELCGLPGLHSGEEETATVAQQQLQLEIQAKCFIYKAFRCRYLSQAHLLLNRFVECSALLTRTLRHCNDANYLLDQLKSESSGGRQQEQQSEDEAVCINCRVVPGHLPATLSDNILPSLRETVHADQLICRANRCLENATDTGIASNSELLNCSKLDLPLFERMDEFALDPSLQKKTTVANSNGRLIQLPPEFEPITIKPVFFDLAQHHIHMPNLEERLSELNPSGTGAGTGVLKKMWRSLWWGGASGQ